MPETYTVALPIDDVRKYLQESAPTDPMAEDSPALSLLALHWLSEYASDNTSVTWADVDRNTLDIETTYPGGKLRSRIDLTAEGDSTRLVRTRVGGTRVTLGGLATSLSAVIANGPSIFHVDEEAWSRRFEAYVASRKDWEINGERYQQQADDFHERLQSEWDAEHAQWRKTVDDCLGERGGPVSAVEKLRAAQAAREAIAAEEAEFGRVTRCPGGTIASNDLSRAFQALIRKPDDEALRDDFTDRIQYHIGTDDPGSDVVAQAYRLATAYLTSLPQLAAGSNGPHMEMG